jgi:hypothetical protein
MALRWVGMGKRVHGWCSLGKLIHLAGSSSPSVEEAIAGCLEIAHLSGIAGCAR